jgi:hypothetical protein
VPHKPRKLSQPYVYVSLSLCSFSNNTNKHACML